VILLAADENFKPLGKDETKEIKRKYDLNFSFILYVGNLAKHKNIPRLIDAFYKITKKGIAHKLVITGKKDGNTKKYLRK